MQTLFIDMNKQNYLQYLGYETKDRTNWFGIIKPLRRRCKAEFLTNYSNNLFS